MRDLGFCVVDSGDNDVVFCQSVGFVAAADDS
jgi:hypothetical protein